MIDEVKEYFIEKSNEYEKKYGYNYWNNHINYVVESAICLAKQTNSDLEIVQISAILHDIAKVLEIDEDKSHNLSGSIIAVNFLKEKGYPEEKIEKVRKCILYHSGPIENHNLSKEEWCVRNADILSLFDNISIFFYIAYHEYQANYETGRKIVREMIYNKYSSLDDTLKKTYNNSFDIIYKSI